MVGIYYSIFFWGHMDPIWFPMSPATWQATLPNSKSLSDASSHSDSPFLSHLEGLDTLILMGLPVDCLHLEGFSSTDSRLQVLVQSFQGVKLQYINCCSSRAKELQKMGGNGMSIRVLMVAITALLRSVSPDKMGAYLKLKW